jgi:hypothetical protein
MNRRGYALLMVLIFNVLFLGVLYVAWEHIGAILQTESAHAGNRERDRGRLPALGCALRLLENDTPPSDDYNCGIAISVLPVYPNTCSIDDVSTTGLNNSVRKYYKINYKKTAPGAWTVTATLVTAPYSPDLTNAYKFQ